MRTYLVKLGAVVGPLCELLEELFAGTKRIKRVANYQITQEEDRAIEPAADGSLQKKYCKAL